MSLVYTEIVGRSGSSSCQQRRHGLYVGSKTDAKSHDHLQQWGITHILNVTPPKEASLQAGVANYFERSSTLTYKRIPIYDDSTTNLLTHANAIVQFIASGLCHGSVLVHCQRGISRSVSCVALFLMRKAGMTFHDAMTTIRQKRPTAQPIPAFVSQLQDYERRCIELGVIVASTTKQHRSKKRPLNSQHSDDDDNEKGEATTQLQTSTTAVASNKKSRRIIGPTAAPASVAVVGGPPTKARAKIGPELPPTTTLKSSKPAGGASSETKKEKIYGPQLPPSSTHEQRRSITTTESEKETTVTTSGNRTSSAKK